MRPSSSVAKPERCNLLLDFAALWSWTLLSNTFSLTDALFAVAEVATLAAALWPTWAPAFACYGLRSSQAPVAVGFAVLQTGL